MEAWSLGRRGVAAMQAGYGEQRSCVVVGRGGGLQFGEARRHTRPHSRHLESSAHLSGSSSHPLLVDWAGAVIVDLPLTCA